MESVEQKVQHLIQSDLDAKQGAISGGAFQRNAKLIESSQTDIQFSVFGEQVRTEEISRENPARDCKICTNSYNKDIAQSFRESPFKESSEFFIPRSETHREIKCGHCNGTGKIECRDCYGDGFEECFDCRGEGYEIVNEDCDTCNDTSGNTGCQACDGSGQIEYKESCTRCNGTGRESCRTCDGDGMNQCSDCIGEGKLHEYKQFAAKIGRDYSSTGLSGVWAGNLRATAEALDLPQSEFTDGGDTYWLQTEKADAHYFTYKYSHEAYEVVVANTSAGTSVAWHPDTSYPKTSLRRKMADLKSRLFDSS